VSDTDSVPSGRDGIYIAAYPGDEAVLLTFDLDEDLTQHLAGFALRCAPPEGRPYYVRNRLNFATAVTAETLPQGEPGPPRIGRPSRSFGGYTSP
jgi:hypothetical protein